MKFFEIFVLFLAQNCETKVLTAQENLLLESLLEFWRKHNFLQIVVFQPEMFGLTSLGHDIGVCIANALISIIKYWVNLLRISFNDVLKGTPTYP